MLTDSLWEHPSNYYGWCQALPQFLHLSFNRTDFLFDQGTEPWREDETWMNLYFYFYFFVFEGED